MKQHAIFLENRPNRNENDCECRGMGEITYNSEIPKLGML